MIANYYNMKKVQVYVSSHPTSLRRTDEGQWVRNTYLRLCFFLQFMPLDTYISIFLHFPVKQRVFETMHIRLHHIIPFYLKQIIRR